MPQDYEHAARGGSAASRRALTWAFLINLVFLILEVIGGLVSGSLALLADAGHMLSDVAALAVALWVAHIVRKRATSAHSYGYGRIEVLSGFVNGLVLWAISLFIGVEAYQRFLDPPEVDVAVMLPVAFAGLLANVGSAWVLWAHRGGDLNLRAAFLHLAADAAGSIGAILAGIGIWLRGWAWVDPLASVLIGVLIVISSWGIVRDSLHILLEGTPSHIDLDDVHGALLSLPDVHGCHDLHIWAVGSREPMLTAHLEVEAGAQRTRVLQEAAAMIRERFRIKHTTLQIEGEPCDDLHD